MATATLFAPCPPPSPSPGMAAPQGGGGSGGPFGALGTPSMSGLLYDVGNYQANIRQSVGPGQYVLAAVAPNCHACLPTDPRIAVGTVGASHCASMSLVDVESDLHNIPRRATNAPCGLYRGDGSPPSVCGLPAGSASSSDGGAFRPFPTCQGLPTVDTRLVNPPCTLRGTGWNRFEWLCRDPQQRALMPFDAYVDTSIVVKDNHRPFLAKPVDPTLALPPGKHDKDASVGAPNWLPKTCNGVGSVDEPPMMLWNSC